MIGADRQRAVGAGRLAAVPLRAVGQRGAKVAPDERDRGAYLRPNQVVVVVILGGEAQLALRRVQTEDLERRGSHASRWRLRRPRVNCAVRP